MLPYTHYIFDLDRTLVVLKINWSELHEKEIEIFAQHGIDYHFVSTIDSNTRLNDLIRRDGDATRTQINDMIRHAELNNLHGYTLIPRAVLFLKNLPSDTTKYVWTGNSHDTATKALVDNDLMKYFEKIAARDNVPYTKPYPSGFKMLYDPQVPKSQYVMIGDSENDEVASHNAGIDFIHVNTL